MALKNYVIDELLYINTMLKHFNSITTIDKSLSELDLRQSLMKEQDEAFASSPAADRQKDRLKAEKLKEEADLLKRCYVMKELLPEEPCSY